MKRGRFGHVAFAFALGVALVHLTWTKCASAAPSVSECLAASEKANTYSSAHQLVEAKAAFGICAAASCPAEVQSECTRRLAETIAALPTVLFEAKDDKGSDVTGVTVSVDGGPAEALGAISRPMNPGEHKLRFEADGFPPVDKVYVIREGDKSRREPLVFTKPVVPGKLALHLAPATATATVDGSKVDPASPLPLSPGSHHLVVSAPGFQTVEHDVTIPPGGAADETIDLPRAAPAPVAPAAPAPAATPAPAIAATTPTTSDDSDTYAGSYNRVEALFLFNGNDPPVNGTGSPASNDFGGTAGFGLHLGYSFPSYVALEATALLSYQAYTEDATTRGLVGSPEAFTIKYQTLNGFLGVGPRVSTHGDVVRGTFGTNLGLSVRSFQVNRNVSTGNFAGGASSVSPALLFDGGITLGKTPGTRVFLGVMALVDFLPTTSVTDPNDPVTAADAFLTPDRSYLVSDGMRFFIGPTIGIQSGR